MDDDLTKKGLPRKNAAGRKKLFTEETIELRRLVPKSHFARIETIVDYELEKLKIKR